MANKDEYIIQSGRPIGCSAVRIYFDAIHCSLLTYLSATAGYCCISMLIDYTVVVPPCCFAGKYLRSYHFKGIHTKLLVF